MENPRTSGDPFGDQLRAAGAEGELAAAMDALREFAEENGFNPELGPRELLAKATGSFRACAAMSDARYDEIERLRSEIDAMRPRLMPEGMEWPRFEDGEPVLIGDRVPTEVGGEELFQVHLGSSGYSLYTETCDEYRGYGERVERPEPKVLDADGAEIRVGDTVWAVGDAWPSMDVLEIKPCDDPDEPEHLVWCGEMRGDPLSDAGKVKRWRIADQLTHRVPVLAADGRPLRVGEMVYSTENGAEFTVMAVDAVSAGVHVRWGYDFEDKSGTIAAELLTHERPVADSWERLEEDCAKGDLEYCIERGLLDPSCDAVEGDASSRHCIDCGCTCGEKMARDLVRRAKKLAERGQ